MKKRTEEEIEAYIDGYNACYNSFVSGISKYKSGKICLDEALSRVSLMKLAVNSVLGYREEVEAHADFD